MSNFDSLTLALEDWFATPLCELPDALRRRVEKEFAPMPWDQLSAEARRSVTLQLDYQHDPATDREREYWWDFFHRKAALEAALEQQDSGERANLDALLNGNGRTKDIRDQIRRMKDRERQAQAAYYPQRRVPVQDLPPGKYTAYPRALHQLSQRLGSTPEELAAWVWLGPQHGGLPAYLNVNELDPPPRFDFGALPIFGNAGEEDADYVAPLMGCWFSSDDIANFLPADRFITGKLLTERWNAIPGLKVEPFIRAKIQESRLMDLHPIYGGTQAGSSSADHLPQVTEGLFRLADVEAIEAEDFSDDGIQTSAPADSAQPVDGAAFDCGSVTAAVADAGDATLSLQNIATGLQIDPVKNEAEDVNQKAEAAVGTQVVTDETSDVPTQQTELEVGSTEWRKRNAQAAANAKHNRPGGSRDKKAEICRIWASGKYSSRSICAEEECAALGMALTTAIKALRNTPDPARD